MQKLTDNERIEFHSKYPNLHKSIIDCGRDRAAMGFVVASFEGKPEALYQALNLCYYEDIPVTFLPHSVAKVEEVIS